MKHWLLTGLILLGAPLCADSFCVSAQDILPVSHSILVAETPAVSNETTGLIPPVPWGHGQVASEQPMRPLSEYEENKRKPNQQVTHVLQAFEVPLERVAAKPNEPDLAILISEAEPESKTIELAGNTETTQSVTTRVPVALLTRLAGEARSFRSLERLISRCHEALANSGASGYSEAEQIQVKKIAAWAYQSRGQKRAQLGQHQQALADYAKAIAFSPTMPTSYLLRGTLLAECGRQQEALADFDQTLRLDVNNLLALRNRAALLLTLRQPKRSYQDSSRGIALWKSLPEGRDPSVEISFHELAGNALVQMGQVEKAAQTFAAGLNRAPDNGLLRLRRGALFASQGLYEQASVDLLASVEDVRLSRPEMAEAYRCLAWLFATCPEPRYRNGENAVESARRARLFSDADNGRIFEASAAAHALAKDYAQAVQFQEQAVLAAGTRDLAEQRLALYRRGLPYVAAAPSRSKASLPSKQVQQATHLEYR